MGKDIKDVIIWLWLIWMICWIVIKTWVINDIIWNIIGYIRPFLLWFFILVLIVNILDVKIEKTEDWSVNIKWDNNLVNNKK